MPTETISLTEDQSRFIASQIEAGRFKDTAEVIAAGLGALNVDEHEYQTKLAALRAAIDEGDASGEAEGDVFAEVFASIRNRAAARAEER